MQQPTAGKPAVGRAIYMLTNDAENAVVALPIGADGMLSKGKVMKTRGADLLLLMQRENLQRLMRSLVSLL